MDGVERCAALQETGRQRLLRHGQVDASQGGAVVERMRTERANRRRQHYGIYPAHPGAQIRRHHLHAVAESERPNLRVLAVERRIGVRADTAVRRQPGHRCGRVVLKCGITYRGHRARNGDVGQSTAPKSAGANSCQALVNVHAAQFGATVKRVRVDGRHAGRQHYLLQVGQRLKRTRTYRRDRIRVVVVRHRRRNRHRRVCRIHRLARALVLHDLRGGGP